MPPSAFRLVVVESAAPATLRARPLNQIVMSQVNVDLARFEQQLHGVYEPGRFDSKNSSVKFVILHPQIVSLGNRPTTLTHYKA